MKLYSSIVIGLAFGIANVSYALSSSFCSSYTTSAMAAANMAKKYTCSKTGKKIDTKDGFAGPRWSTDGNVHSAWCNDQTNQAVVTAQTAMRDEQLETCKEQHTYCNNGSLLAKGYLKIMWFQNFIFEHQDICGAYQVKTAAQHTEDCMSLTNAEAKNILADVGKKYEVCVSKASKNEGICENYAKASMDLIALAKKVDCAMSSSGGAGVADKKFHKDWCNGTTTAAAVGAYNDKVTFITSCFKGKMPTAAAAGIK